MTEATPEEWAEQTCRTVCTITDLRQICKHRDFPPIKKGNKEAYAEHVQMRLLQETGLDKALDGLNEESLWALHALKCAGRALKIKDLYVLFGLVKPGHYYEAEVLKSAFEQVRSSLLRRGIVLIRDSRDWNSWKGSRWFNYEVLLPDSVAARLPPPPLVTEAVGANPPFNDWEIAVLENIRSDLLSATGSSSRDTPIVPRAKLVSGALQLGDAARIALDKVAKAVRNRWLGLTIRKRKAKDVYDAPPVGPFASTADPTSSNKRTGATDLGNARGHLLEAVPNGHGITEASLRAACEKFNCPFTEDEFRIFIEEGVRFGYLVVVDRRGERLLVPNPGPEPESSRPTFDAIEEAAAEVRIPLEKIGLAELLLLAQVSELRVAGGKLHARPSPVYIGRLLPSLGEFGGIEALLTASAAHKQAFKTVEERSGRFIVHSNVSVIRIASDELRHLLLARFSEKTADLGEGYFAVSRNDLPALVDYGKKKGFTPKMMTKEASPSSE